MGSLCDNFQSKMAALIPRVGRKTSIWKHLMSSASKRSISVKSSPHRLQTVVDYRHHSQRSCTPILYSRFLKRSSLVLGARHYSQETGGENLDEMIGNTTTAENPFLTDPQTAMDSISTAGDILKDTAHTLNSLGEPTLTSLGLGGSSPIGCIQQIVELIHTSCNLPWVWSIVAATVGFRLLMLPLIVKAQANGARLNNIRPQLEEVQNQLRELMNTNDSIGKATATQKLKQLYKDNNCHPMRSILAPLVQMPLFISFFVGLRRMANLPVESFQSGGLLWFTDLTAADPYFVLPVLCSFTMLATIERGSEAGIQNPQMQNMKSVMRIMSVVMIPLTAYFPTAIFTYWITSNLFSLGQISILNLKSVRQYFDIPDMKVHENQTPQGGFFENMKAGYKNAQESAYVKHHEKMKRQRAKALGTAPLEPTYEHNPRIKHNQQVFSAADKTGKKDKLKNKPGPTM